MIVCFNIYATEVRYWGFVSHLKGVPFAPIKAFRVLKTTTTASEGLKNCNKSEQLYMKCSLPIYLLSFFCIMKNIRWNFTLWIYYELIRVKKQFGTISQFGYLYHHIFQVSNSIKTKYFTDFNSNYACAIHSTEDYLIFTHILRLNWCVSTAKYPILIRNTISKH